MNSARRRKAPAGPGRENSVSTLAHDAANVKEIRFRERMLAKYQAALRESPPPGTRHAWILRCANLAALADIPAPQACQEITAALPRPPNPPREVSDAVEKAYAEHGARAALGLGAYVPPKQKPEPKYAPRLLRDYIRRGEGATEADFFHASPVMLGWGDDWRLDAVAQLKALFHPAELVFCGDQFGKTVRPAAEWVRHFEAGGKLPPLFIPNPLRPEGGKTKSEGKPSGRCDDAVAVFRHAVAEFDSKLCMDADGNAVFISDGKSDRIPKNEVFPLSEQLAFWRAWGLGNVSAMTYSGGKSYHVLLRVDAADAEEWRSEVRGRLFERHLMPLGCDGQCRNPARLSRLAGARDPKHGFTVQKLLFVRPPLAGWRELEANTRAADAAGKDAGDEPRFDEKA